MNNKDFIAKLKELSACSEAIEFVGDMNFKTAWNKCERADWMLWLICKMEIGTKRERIHIICDCAATSLKYVPKGEDRPRLAIEAARTYADNSTQENLDKLNKAAGAAEAAARAAEAAMVARAAWSAWSAAWSAWAARAAGAAEAAARAAEAATWATYEEMCDMIRKSIKLK